MTRKTLITTQNETTQFGDAICLQYYLLTDDVCFDGGMLENYGIEVVLQRPGTCLQESCAVRNITPVSGRILELLCKTAQWAVTPCTLKKTLTELL
jgi:hypothetical protein